ncbi:hypothetical protein C8R44DRAFT_811312, partial [Mycena epipterygia]
MKPQFLPKSMDESWLFSRPTTRWETFRAVPCDSTKISPNAPTISPSKRTRAEKSHFSGESFARVQTLSSVT